MNTKKKIISISLFFIILFLALIIFIIVPLIKEIKILSSDYKSNQEEIFLLENRLLAINKIENDYEEFLEDYTENIDLFFVDYEVPIEFIRFIESTASSSNILVKISSFSSEEDKDNLLKFMNIRISAEGEFVNLMNFLEIIEKNSYFVETYNLEMKKISEEIISFSMLIKVFAK